MANPLLFEHLHFGLRQFPLVPEKSFQPAYDPCVEFADELLAHAGPVVWSLESIRNFQAETKRLEETARNTLQKDKRVDIRLSSRDLERLQMRAAREGVPYQTYIAGSLHKLGFRAIARNGLTIAWRATEWTARTRPIVSLTHHVRLKKLTNRS